MPSSETRDEIQKLLASLLIARKESNTTGVPLAKLDQDYRDETGKRIPFRQFGHGCLVDFLQSLTDRLIIRQRGGTHYAFPVVSEKTQHVSSLVAGQNQRKIARPTRRMYKPSAYYPKVRMPPMRLDSRQLSEITKLVKRNPNGVHHREILDFVRYILNCSIEWTDLGRQLRDIRHEVEVMGDFVYPATANHRQEQYEKQPLRDFSTNGESRAASKPPGFNKENNFARPAGFSDSDRDDYSADYYASNGDILQEKENNTFINKRKSDETKPELPTSDSNEKPKVRRPPGFDELKESSSTNDNATDHDAISQLINERTRIRLQRLIEKHPDGIWCADLPEVYRKEYTIPLCYEELGFISVIEFVSHLPEIFHCARLQDKGDFKLFDAKSGVPNIKPRERPKIPSLATLHNIYEQYFEPTEPVPSVLSKTTMEKLIPDGVMTAEETVAQICVTELDRGIHEYIDVVVSDVFTPSFFWIQLLQRVARLQRFMTELHEFYELNSKKYLLPIAVMKKGMNCACTYDGKWHRAIIKSVRPDNYVTLMFYDYGTIKSYPAECIHFLHRKFSNLPAQAIPCGLYNVKPVSGNHWSRNISCEFVNKTTNVPLVATIASIDTENNSMLVALTNTEGSEDFHINDWMVQSGFAVYGNMVCMRPRNFPLQRHLECKLLKSLDNDKKILSSDSKNVDSNANDARIESDLLEKRNFYDRLLKLRREARARKGAALSGIESSGEESENRLLHGKQPQEKHRERKIVEENIVELEDKSRHASDQSNSDTSGKSFEWKKLRDLCKSHQKRKLYVNFSANNVPEKQHPHNRISQADLAKHCNIETPTDGSTTDEDPKPNIPNEIVPLHLKDPGTNESLSEFGTLRSSLGGNGRMEFIDWTSASKTAKNDQKTNVSNRPMEMEEKLTKDSIKHEPKMQKLDDRIKLATHEMKKTVEEIKPCADPIGKENDENKNWNGPKIPLAKRALWNLVKNNQKQSSPHPGGIESTENKKDSKSGTGDENGDPVKKKTPIFPIIETNNIPQVEKYGRKGEKGHWESVPLREMEKPLQNPGTREKVLITKKNDKLSKYAVPFNLPKADKRFIRVINEVVLSKSAEDELAFVSEGNIKVRKHRHLRLRMIKKKLEEKRKERVKRIIPVKILDVMMKDFTKDQSDDQDVNLSLSPSEEIKTSSESVGDMDEASTASLNSTRSRNLADFLQSQDSSSENSIDKPPCPSEKKSSGNAEESSHNKTNSCSKVEKSSNSGEENVEKRAISQYPENADAWFQNVRPKLSTPQRSLIHSQLHSTFNSTLDSDDLSPFEENKADNDETRVTVNSPLRPADNSRIEDHTVKNKSDNSAKFTNEICSDDDKNNKKLTTAFSKTATCNEAPVFDDLNLESNDDEWDYSPGWVTTVPAPEACRGTMNYPAPSTSQSVVIEELDPEKIANSDGSSLEISENADITSRSSGSSGRETDTDTQTTDNKYHIIEEDSPVNTNLNFTKDSTPTKSDSPLDNDEPRTSSRSCDSRSDKNPLIDPSGNTSSNDESPMRRASLEQSLSSARKRYSILSEIQNSPIFNKATAALDSSSSEEQSDSSYTIPFIRTIRRYF